MEGHHIDQKIPVLKKWCSKHSEECQCLESCPLLDPAVQKMEVDEPSRCGVTELGSPVGPSELFMVDSLPDRVSTALYEFIMARTKECETWSDHDQGWGATFAILKNDVMSG